MQCIQMLMKSSKLARGSILDFVVWGSVTQSHQLTAARCCATQVLAGAFLFLLPCRVEQDWTVEICGDVVGATRLFDLKKATTN